MKYFFAIFLPPVAVLLCGKPGSFLLNLILTLCGWVPGVVHAIIVVGSYNADKRTDRIVDALNRPDSGIPSLPQAAKQGRPMKFVLFACGLAFVAFCALAVTVAGLRNRMPTQTDVPAAVVEEANSESAPSLVPDKNKKKGKGGNNKKKEKGGKNTAEDEAAPAKLPPYTIIDDKTKPGGDWRIVEVRLQEKASEDDLRRISEDVKAANPKKFNSTRIFYVLPEQIGGAWAIANFAPNLKIEVVGTPKGTLPPKPDGEIIGQWEYATIGMYLTLTRTKDGLKMICTVGADNTPSSDHRVTAKVDGSRVVIRPVEKADDLDSYWILDEAKHLLMMDETGNFGKAAAIIKPTLKL